MRIIVGLGNPGKDYEKTRHNVGFMVVDKILAKNQKFKLNKKFEAEVCICDASGVTPVVLAKPVTFMNESGRSVRKIMDFYKLKVDDLWVIHDDLDIALGKFKIQKGVGPKTHKGVLSVENQVGKDFWRVRVGIENRLDKNILGEEYTLKNFAKEEVGVVDGVIREIVGSL
jgi:PTH1 family peptidyl-tRNA hydrolase